MGARQVSADAPFELIYRGARGDAEALSGLVDHAFVGCWYGSPGWAGATRMAETFARMAATHGNRNHILKLAACLFYSSQTASDEGDGVRSVMLQAEAISLVDALADGGDEEAAEMLVMACDELDPAVVTMAADMCRFDALADKIVREA